MRYKEALAWLFGTQRFGIKLGLDNIQRLLRELDLPSKEQRAIHVAGTNGKGSVCAMIESIARAQGYRTGLFTSPHLVTFRERIQVNGEMISAEDVASGLGMIRELVRDWDPHPTFFEIATALGLHHFREQSCEIIVLETGMGGRLDATNAVTPVVSIITPIDYDHQKWLGNTLTEIAAEKAGIIKLGIPVVSARQPAEAEAVIREVADKQDAPVQFISASYRESEIGLRGPHQTENAALAIAALNASHLQVGKDALLEGLKSVTWPARFQHWDDRITIDGAHNPAGARMLAQTWCAEFGSQRATILLALLRDKDAAGIISALAPIARRFILPPIRSERAVPQQELHSIIGTVTTEIETQNAASLDAALFRARNESDRIVIAGSLHFAGEALAVLQGDPDALEDCFQ